MASHTFDAQPSTTSTTKVGTTATAKTYDVHAGDHPEACQPTAPNHPDWHDPVAVKETTTQLKNPNVATTTTTGLGSTTYPSTTLPSAAATAPAVREKEFVGDERSDARVFVDDPNEKTPAWYQPVSKTEEVVPPSGATLMGTGPTVSHIPVTQNTTITSTNVTAVPTYSGVSTASTAGSGIGTSSTLLGTGARDKQLEERDKALECAVKEKLNVERELAKQEANLAQAQQKAVSTVTKAEEKAASKIIAAERKVAEAESKFAAAGTSSTTTTNINQYGGTKAV